MLSCKFAAYFKNTFSREHLWTVASGDLPSKESAELGSPITEYFTALVYKRKITINEVLREMLVKDGRDLK